jgi:hypothetical protein
MFLETIFLVFPSKIRACSITRRALLNKPAVNKTTPAIGIGLSKPTMGKPILNCKEVDARIGYFHLSLRLTLGFIGDTSIIWAITLKFLREHIMGLAYHGLYLAIFVIRYFHLSQRTTYSIWGFTTWQYFPFILF